MHLVGLAWLACTALPFSYNTKTYPEPDFGGFAFIEGSAKGAVLSRASEREAGVFRGAALTPFS